MALISLQEAVGKTTLRALSELCGSAVIHLSQEFHRRDAEHAEHTLRKTIIPTDSFSEVSGGAWIGPTVSTVFPGRSSKPLKRFQIAARAKHPTKLNVRCPNENKLAYASQLTDVKKIIPAKVLFRSPGLPDRSLESPSARTER